MSLPHALGIFGAGIVAGTINTVVGSGTLFTFPVLLAFGYAPVTANVSNTVGLVPGSAAGAFGYREELRGQRARLLRLSAASVTGETAKHGSGPKSGTSRSCWPALVSSGSLITGT